MSWQKQLTATSKILSLFIVFALMACGGDDKSANPLLLGNGLNGIQNFSPNCAGCPNQPLHKKAYIRAKDGYGTPTFEIGGYFFGDASGNLAFEGLARSVTANQIIPANVNFRVRTLVPGKLLALEEIQGLQIAIEGTPYIMTVGKGDGTFTFINEVDPLQNNTEFLLGGPNRLATEPYNYYIAGEGLLTCAGPCVNSQIRVIFDEY